MTALKKWPVWLWMLTKRLYKKPVFLILLLLIPLVVIGYRFSVRDTGSVLNVGLIQNTPEPLAQEIFSDLQADNGLIHYQIFHSEADAREHLTAGKLDAVWVFADDLQTRIATYAEDPAPENAFITVLTQSENITLALSRERLSATVYKEVARVVYVNYLRENFPEIQDIPDGELLKQYDNTPFSQELFTFGEAGNSPEENNFLLSPLRGLLGVIITLCGLAAALQYIHDRQNGTFTWLSPRWQILPELSCQLVAVAQLSLVSLICLAVSGLSRGFLLELAAAVLYSLCVAAFAMLLRSVFRSAKTLAVVLPVLCVAMLVLCPVFLDLGALRKLQFLLPPTYYIRAVYEPVWLGYMALYTAMCGGLWWLTGKIKHSLR